MTRHYARELLALSLVAALGVAAPTHAMATEAKAGVELMSIRCFMGTPGGRMEGTRFDGDLHRGWFCIPEERAAVTH